MARTQKRRRANPMTSLRSHVLSVLGRTAKKIGPSAPPSIRRVGLRVLLSWAGDNLGLAVWHRSVLQNAWLDVSREERLRPGRVGFYVTSKVPPEMALVNQIQAISDFSIQQDEFRRTGSPNAILIRRPNGTEVFIDDDNGACTAIARGHETEMFTGALHEVVTQAFTFLYTLSQRYG
jgi:hypothetical protein